MKVIYALLIKVTQNSLQVILNSIQVIGWIQKFLIKIQNSVKITFIVCCTPWQILNAEPKCCLGKKYIILNINLILIGLSFSIQCLLQWPFVFLA